MPVPFACCWSNGGNLTTNMASERSSRTTIEELNKLQSSPEYHEWMKKQRYSGHLTLIAMLLIGLALTSTQATWRTSAKDNEIHIAQSSSILATHEMDLSSTEQNASVTPIPATIVCNCPQPDYRATVRLEQEKEALQEEIADLQMKLKKLTLERKEQKAEHKKDTDRYKRLLIGYQAGFIFMIFAIWKGWIMHTQSMDKLNKEKMAIHLEERAKLLAERDCLTSQASELDALREQCKSMRYVVDALPGTRKKCEKLKVECDELREKCESLKTISSANLSLLTRKKSLEVQVGRVRELQDVINVLEPKAAVLPDLRHKQYELLARCGTCNMLQDRLKNLENEAGRLPNLQSQCDVLQCEVNKVHKLHDECEKLRKTADLLEPFKKKREKLLVWVDTVQKLEAECCTVHKNLQTAAKKLEGKALERLQLMEDVKVDELVDNLIEEL